MSQATAARNADTTVGKLSTLDRYLPLWIGLAMAAGLLLGRNVPGLNSALEKVQVDGISLPIAVGLLIMMYPVLAKVRYDRLGSVAGDRKLLGGSLMLNWVLGPALMFTLAWLLLPDLPEYRTGLIIVGLARCIAMVVIWNDLACGDREAAAVLVALNSLFQVLAFAALGWFYLSVLPGWLHLPQAAITASPWGDRHISLDISGNTADGRISVPTVRREGQRAWLVRVEVPASDQPVGAIRIVVHHRDSLRVARRPNHLPSLGRGTNRAAAAGLFCHHVGRGIPARRIPRSRVCAYHHAGIYRRGKQL